MFTATLGTRAHRWKQPKHPSTNGQMDKQNVACQYRGLRLSHKKGWSADTGYNMNEPWKCAKWEKPTTYYVIPFMWNIQRRKFFCAHLWIQPQAGPLWNPIWPFKRGHSGCPLLTIKEIEIVHMFWVGFFGGKKSKTINLDSFFSHCLLFPEIG